MKDWQTYQAEVRAGVYEGSNPYREPEIVAYSIDLKATIKEKLTFEQLFAIADLIFPGYHDHELSPNEDGTETIITHLTYEHEEGQDAEIIIELMQQDLSHIANSQIVGVWDENGNALELPKEVLEAQQQEAAPNTAA